MTRDEELAEWFQQTDRVGRCERLKNVVIDLVGVLMYYDRKEDENLPRGGIEHMVETGEVTYAEIAEWFAEELKSQE